jgi:hypothetical protein
MEAHDVGSGKDLSQAMRELEADNIRLIFQVEHLNYLLKKNQDKLEY